MDIFETQYRMIQQTRKSLFRYCETVTQEDYVREVETLSGASIRNKFACPCSRLLFPKVQASWHSDSVEITELWLFTHTITHEFHHQGQIVKDRPEPGLHSTQNELG